MAQEKKSIIVYADWLPQFEQLSDEEAGKLIKHFFRYVNDLNPEPPDRLTQIAFEPLKQSLKRDLKKWEKVLEKRSLAGKASAEARKKAKELDEQNLTNPTHVKSVQQNSTNPTVNDNVTVSVSVNDNVSDITSTKVDVVEFDNTDNENFRDNLKFESQQWIESVAMQQKISTQLVKEKLDEFAIFLFNTQKKHPNKKEFISHFINWLPKNLEKNGTKQQFRFSTDEAVKTVISQDQ